MEDLPLRGYFFGKHYWALAALSQEIHDTQVAIARSPRSILLLGRDIAPAMCQNDRCGEPRVIFKVQFLGPLLSIVRQLCCKLLILARIQGRCS